jgi:hypothetical protein
MKKKRMKELTSTQSSVPPPTPPPPQAAQPPAPNLVDMIGLGGNLLQTIGKLNQGEQISFISLFSH